MTNTTKNARTNGNGSNNKTTKREETTMNTEKMLSEIIGAMNTQTQAISALLASVEKLEKSSAGLDKAPTETKVQPTRTRKPAQASAPTREEKPAKQPKKQAAAEKKQELKTLKKFGTQVYLRAPRAQGNAEIAHINTQTKRGRCVFSIHANKVQTQDMPLIREFIRAYEDKLSYTAKLAAQGIKDAASLRKATDAQLMAAFGC